MSICFRVYLITFYSQKICGVLSICKSSRVALRRDSKRSFISFIESPPRNKDEILAVMRRMSKTKSDLADTLRRRLKSYQLRKDQHGPAS